MRNLCSSGKIGTHSRRGSPCAPVLGPANGSRRIEGDHPANDQVVKEHANSRQVLLDGGRGSRMLFNVGSDQDGLDLVECDVVLLTPGKETGYGTSIGNPGVGISNVGDKELHKPAPGLRAGVVNHRRQIREAGSR